jgi:signal transduction histidine kinase
VADLVGTFWLTGVWSEVFPAVSESILSPIGFAAYATLFGCGCWHARIYLNTKHWAPNADRLLNLVGWLWLTLTAWFALAFPGGARVLMVWGGTATALLVVTVSVMAARQHIRFSAYEAATWLTSLVFVMSYLIARLFNQPLLWSSSALALVQAIVIAILYGVAMSQHLLRQKVLLEQSEREAVLQREMVAASMRERSLIYAATNHDLRQPLLGISVFVDLLKTADKAEERANYANKLSMALGEVDDILVSMQQLSAVNEEAHKPPMEVMGLNDVLVPLIEEYRSRSQYKNITIRYVPSRLTIHTHTPYFQRIVRNALANAIRYIEPGGRILVGCRHGGGLRLVIADTGRGMSAKQTEQAFDAFTRFDSESVKNQGAGLGLFSTQSLAKALGLKVGLQSQQGHGTAFCIHLPLPVQETGAGDAI